MSIEQRKVRSVIVLSIVGDITTYGARPSRVADTVRSALQLGHDQIVLDLGHVRYVDSSGLGDLVQAVSAVRNRGGSITLLNVTARVKALLEVTRLLTVFDDFYEARPESSPSSAPT